MAEERGLLARELHDSIAQSLAFLKIQVGLLRDALGAASAQVERVLGELDAGVHESLSDVRELLVHFRTRTNAEDIAPALKTTLQKFEHQTGLPTHLAIDGNGLPLRGRRAGAGAARGAGGAVQRAQARAGAQGVGRGAAGAALARRGARRRLRIRQPAWPSDETHVGLRIMRERAQRIGATVEVASMPGSGTRVVLTLPERQRLAA